MLDKSSFLHLKRFRVEELKARLLALEAMKQGLEDNVRQLDDALERENLRSGDSTIARLAMPNIRQMIEFRRKNIEKTRADLERDKDDLETQLTSALQEVKAAEFAELERSRRASQTAEAIAEFRRERQLMQQHLRRHAMR
jgi:flagellar FliJ protein